MNPTQRQRIPPAVDEFSPTMAVEYVPSTCRLILPSPEGCELVLVLNGGICDGKEEIGRDP